eukprot:scaffold25636_cov57-Phaeocystis_antarctica.AAC.2
MPPDGFDKQELPARHVVSEDGLPSTTLQQTDCSTCPAHRLRLRCPRPGSVDGGSPGNELAMWWLGNELATR